MKSGIPWQVKGVRDDARDTARDAARRAGMSVGEWLNHVIFEQSDETLPPRRTAQGGAAFPDDHDERDFRGEQDFREDRDTGGRRRRNRPSRSHRTDRAPARDENAGARRAARYDDDEAAMADARAPRHRSHARDDFHDTAFDDNRAAPRRRNEARNEARSEAGRRNRDGSEPQHLAAMDRKLDLLGRDIERLARKPRADETDHLADAIARIEQRLDRLGDAERSRTRDTRDDKDVGRTSFGGGFNEDGFDDDAFLDTALAEIAARQQILDADRPHGKQPGNDRQEPAPNAERQRPEPRREAFAQSDILPRPVTQDLSGLERQLRTITTQIESLRSPALNSAVEEMRQELHTIARTMEEALPRHSVEALEQEIRFLAERLDERRSSGAEPEAIALLERGLREVRNEIRSLTPAENLAGLHHMLDGIARKVDAVAGGPQDARTLQQLEQAIATLRGVTSHVASNDALNKVSEEMRMLAGAVERLETAAHSAVSNEVLHTLDQRIAMLAQALESRSTAPAPASPQIESLLKKLVDRMERAPDRSGGEQTALATLETRIARLVEKLDASGTRLNNLETIERALTELLVHFEQQRARPAGSRGGDMPSAISDEVRAIKHELADIKSSEMRTQEAVEAAHGTLGHLVDRLAMIEGELRHGVRPGPGFAGTAPDLPPMPGRRREREAAPPGSGFGFTEHRGTDLFDDARETDSRSSAYGPLDLTEADLAPAIGRLDDWGPDSGRDLPGQPERSAANEKPSASEDLRWSPASGAATDAAFLPVGVAGEAAGEMREEPAPRTEHLPLDPSLPPDYPLEPGSARSQRPSAAERIAASEQALGSAKPPIIPDPGNKGDFIAAARRAAMAASASAAADIAAGQRTGRKAASRMTDIGTAENAELPADPGLMKRVRSLFAVTGVAVVAAGTIGGGIYLYPGSDGATPPPAKVAVTTATPAPAPVQAPAAPEATGTTPPPAAAAQTAAPYWTQNLNIGKAGQITVPAPKTGEQAAARDELPVDIGGAALRRAAIDGDAAAAFEVGSRFADGRGVTQNSAEAARWFGRAADAGIVPAQFRLAGMHEKGIGLPKNLETARRLYRSAAEAGHGKAMHNLAVLFAEGMDGKPDYRNALPWFRKAADHGIADSQYNLGVLYARGIGVSQNLPESYKWFALAAREGDRDAAAKRDDIAGRLDAAQLKSAEKTVAGWTAKPEPEGATLVKAPPGGWDSNSTAQTAAGTRSAEGGPYVAVSRPVRKIQ